MNYSGKIKGNGKHFKPLHYTKNGTLIFEPVSVVVSKLLGFSTMSVCVCILVSPSVTKCHLVSLDIT